MTIGRLVLNVGSVDGNFTSLFFGCLVDLFVSHGLTPSLLGQDFGNGLRQGGFPVIDVSNRPNVHVRFIPRKVGGETAGYRAGMRERETSQRRRGRPRPTQQQRRTHHERTNGGGGGKQWEKARMDSD